MPPKLLITSGLAVSLVWLFVVCLLAERFNIPSADGILYSLPFSHMTNPLRMGIPFLDDFRGYGTAWGHNWPGSMWVKALFFGILPYSRTADVALLSCFHLLSAWVTAGVVWKACSRTGPAVAAFIVILSDRLLLLSCAGNRFESIAVAMVLLLFSLSGRAGRNGPLLAICAFLCPTLHPYSFAIGGIIVAWHFAAVRKVPGTSTWTALVPAFAFVAGCLTAVAWFVMSPEAAAQFTANLALQKSFYQTWNSVLSGLGNYRLSSGVLLWGGAFVAAVLWIAGRPEASRSWQKRMLATVLFFAVAAIHTATRCENFHYLAFGSPFAVILICNTSGWLWNSETKVLRFAATAALVGFAAPHAVLIPVRLLQFRKAGMPNLEKSFAFMLRDLPVGRTVYIPHPMWAAAVEDTHHAIRWFTFPIASTKTMREQYEQTAYAGVKQGDFLIIENGGARQPDRFGLYPTFAVTPPEPAIWIHRRAYKQLFTGTSLWGLDLSVYECVTSHPDGSN